VLLHVVCCCIQVVKTVEVRLSLQPRGKVEVSVVLILLRRVAQSRARIILAVRFENVEDIQALVLVYLKTLIRCRVFVT